VLEEQLATHSPWYMNNPEKQSWQVVESLQVLQLLGQSIYEKLITLSFR